MAVVAVRTDLVLAAVESARLTRDELADALHDLEGELSGGPRGAEVRHRAATAIGALYTVELGDPERIDRGLVDARETLSRLLSELQRADEGPQALLSAIARALTRLHPTSRALGRALGRPIDESGEREAEASLPIPLARRRPSSPDVTAGPEDERRASPRVELRADIGLTSETNFFAGTSGDLSEGGVFVATSEALEVGTRVTLSFVLPDGHAITTPCRVAWVRASSEAPRSRTIGMGLAFVALRDGDRHAVERFMAQRAPLRVG